MNTMPSPHEQPIDPDLAEQARPGHGVPSQDPEPAAQLPLSAEEQERESHSTLMGGGMVAGAATGAAVGVAVGGPLGVLVGGTLGCVAGALGGAAAGKLTGDEGQAAGEEPLRGDTGKKN